MITTHFTQTRSHGPNKFRLLLHIVLFFFIILVIRVLNININKKTHFSHPNIENNNKSGVAENIIITQT
jgi:cell division protein FtsI/penicillin-binding protein 2